MPFGELLGDFRATLRRRVRPIQKGRLSLEGVEIHDIEKTLDTFEKLYRGEPLDA